jgi:NAD(P)-dependent dehydrogenase (short-subunit alcohol dehydrogenase family)
VVTGGASGIGIETVRALLGAGATVVVPARRPDQASEALAGLAGVSIVPLDLGDQAGVRAAAATLLDEGTPVDLLICSAGIMACPETRIGDGWEAQFATNHLGHYTFANLLRPLLEAAPGGARVVALSSAGHRRSPIRFDDLMFEQGDYEKWAAYGQAKTANALFARRLDALGREHGVRAFSVHPGGIMTPLQRHLERDEMVAAGWIQEDGSPAPGVAFKTPEQGAATTVWAATSPSLDGLGGVYCEDCDIADLVPADAPMGTLAGGVRPWAADDEAAARLWAVSAELTGVDAYA